VVALIVAACIGIDPEYWWAYLLIVGAIEGLIGWAYYEFTRATKNLDSWKRKEFKDFEYLGTNMSKGHNLSFWLISLSLSLLVLFLCLIIGR